MSSGPLMQQCTACAGNGLIARERRRMANGHPDPADFRRYDICRACGGGGTVPVDKASIVERSPGFIADEF
jgi:hypothetical protein